MASNYDANFLKIHQYYAAFDSISNKFAAAVT